MDVNTFGYSKQAKALIPMIEESKFKRQICKFIHTSNEMITCQDYNSKESKKYSEIFLKGILYQRKQELKKHYETWGPLAYTLLLAFLEDEVGKRVRRVHKLNRNIKKKEIEYNRLAEAKRIKKQNFAKTILKRQKETQAKKAENAKKFLVSLGYDVRKMVPAKTRAELTQEVTE